MDHLATAVLILSMISMGAGSRSGPVWRTISVVALACILPLLVLETGSSAIAAATMVGTPAVVAAAAVALLLAIAVRHVLRSRRATTETALLVLIGAILCVGMVVMAAFAVDPASVGRMAPIASAGLALLVAGATAGILTGSDAFRVRPPTS